MTWIFLAVSAMITCAIQASLVQNLYMKLEAGQSITGEIETELKARSPQECGAQVSTIQRSTEKIVEPKVRSNQKGAPM